MMVLLQIKVASGDEPCEQIVLFTTSQPKSKRGQYQRTVNFGIKRCAEVSY